MTHVCHNDLLIIIFFYQSVALAENLGYSQASRFAGVVSSTDYKQEEYLFTDSEYFIRFFSGAICSFP